MYYPIICIRKWLWMAPLLVTLRMKARIATYIYSYISRYRTHSSHNSVQTRRGSRTRKFDYSAFSVVRVPPFVFHPSNFPEVWRNCNWSNALKSRLSRRMFRCHPWWEFGKLVKFYLRREQQIIAIIGTLSRNACTEITKRWLRIPRLKWLPVARVYMYVL